MEVVEGELLVKLAPGSSVDQLPDRLGDYQLVPLGELPFTGGRLWRVKYAPVGVRVVADADQEPVVKHTSQSELSLYSALLSQLDELPAVEYAVPHLAYRPTPFLRAPVISVEGQIKGLSFIPDDPLFDPDNFNSNQQVKNFLIVGRWWVEKLQLEQAWDFSRGSNQQAIAIIDSGVDFGHPDLWARWHPASIDLSVPQGDPSAVPLGGFLPGDGQDNNNNGIPDDAAGHGTMTAGVAAGTGNDGFGWVGVDHYSRILSVRIGHHNGDVLTAGEIVSAINYAASQPDVRVISMSFGGFFGSQAEQDAINNAWDAGKVLVAAAGNNSVPRPVDQWSPNTQQQFPAAFPKVLAVAATTNWWLTNQNTLVPAEDLAPWSTFGDWVDLVAPGQDVLVVDSESPFPNTPDPGLRLSPDTISQPGFVERGWSNTLGTSFSTPIVAGVLSLGFALYPEMTNQEAVNLITDPTNLDTFPGVGSLTGGTSYKDVADGLYGNGRVNALKFLQAVLNLKQQKGDGLNPPLPTDLVDLTNPYHLSQNASLTNQGTVRLNTDSLLIGQNDPPSISTAAFRFPAIADGGQPQTITLQLVEQRDPASTLPLPETWLGLGDYTEGRWTWYPLPEVNPAEDPDTGNLISTYNFPIPADAPPFLSGIKGMGIALVSISRHPRELLLIRVLN